MSSRQFLSRTAYRCHFVSTQPNPSHSPAESSSSSSVSPGWVRRIVAGQSVETASSRVRLTISAFRRLGTYTTSFGSRRIARIVRVIALWNQPSAACSLQSASSATIFISSGSSKSASGIIEGKVTVFADANQTYPGIGQTKLPGIFSAHRERLRKCQRRAVRPRYPGSIPFCRRPDPRRWPAWSWGQCRSAPLHPLRRGWR
jgi:hypothetical protein